MEPIQQLMHMRSQAQRAQLEGWLGLQLPFDDEVLEYLLRLSKLVESEELSLLVADFCPQWPEGMQLALAASLSPQALRVPWHGGPGSKQILLEPAPCRQERREPERPSILPRAVGRNATGFQMPTEIRKAKPMLPEVSRDEEFSKVVDPISVDLQQTIKDVVQEQLALQQRLQRSISPKAAKTASTGPLVGPMSRAASPDPEVEKRQKCTAYRPREHSIQEIINQQLLLQEQLRPLADGGELAEAGISSGLELPKAVSEAEGREVREVREVKDKSYNDMDTTATGGFGPPGEEPWMEDRAPMESLKDARFVRAEDHHLELQSEDRPAAARTSRTLPSRGSGASSSSRHRVSTGRFIDVGVNLPNGQTTWQRVRPEATALEVKQRLAEWGFGSVKLTFLGLRLKDHWRLVDCGVRSHDKLQASTKGVTHGRRRDLGEKRQGAGPVPSSCEPSEDASPHSAATATIEEDSRWSAAVVSLQQSLETLQETIKTSQQEQKENLTDHRHSLSMLQQQQQQQLKTLHFIEDQQRSLATSAAESSEMKQGLKQLQLEQQQLHARLNDLDRSLCTVGNSNVEMRNSPTRHVEVQEASPTSSHRKWLILQVFRMLDRDRDGLLQQRELMGLARLMGFNFTEDDWAVEYHDLCRDMSIQPHRGFDPQSFSKLLDSEDGCPATDENLFEALIHHCHDKTRATAAVELFERLDLDRDGFLSASELRDWGLEPTEGADHYGRYDLPAFHLLVSALTLEQLRSEGNEGTKGTDAALPSPEVLADVTSPPLSMLSPVSPVPSQMASTVKSASSPRSPEAIESVASPNLRGELIARLFAALDTDQDGKCTSKDLAVAFASRYEAWPMHFRKICSHWNIKQREGVDAQTFAEILQVPGDLGLYASEEELEEMLQSIQRPGTERRVSTQDRSRLVDALFFYLDTNQDGLLHAPELQRLTSELGVQELQLPSVDLDTFRTLVNDRSPLPYPSCWRGSVEKGKMSELCQ